MVQKQFRVQHDDNGPSVGWRFETSNSDFSGNDSESGSDGCRVQLAIPNRNNEII